MFATVLGIKRAEAEIISRNAAALRMYCAEALAALFEHEKISDALAYNLGIHLDEIQMLHHELRHITEALEKKLDEKYEGLDRYITLCQEIERKRFGADNSPFWLYRTFAEIDEKTLQDERKMGLMKDLFYEKKIVSSKPVTVKEFLLEMLMIPEKHAGAVYLELLNYSGGTTADLAIAAIERWHFQTRGDRQYLKREQIAANIFEEFGIGADTEISLEIEFEAMVETKTIRISSALEREIERKRRQQELQANVREGAHKLQANVQKGVQGLQTNVKKHMPTVKEFFGNVVEKAKSLPKRNGNEPAPAPLPPGMWISSGTPDKAMPAVPAAPIAPVALDAPAASAETQPDGSPMS
jgi:hypothetical protein